MGGSHYILEKSNIKYQKAELWYRCAMLFIYTPFYPLSRGGCLSFSGCSGSRFLDGGYGQGRRW